MANMTAPLISPNAIKDPVTKVPGLEWILEENISLQLSGLLSDDAIGTGWGRVG
jgi:hypothetical protein